MATLTPDPGTRRRGDLPAAAGLLVLAAVFTGLALWQWQRAAESRAVLERHQDAGSLPVLTGPIDPAQVETLRDREIELRGRYVPRPQFLLDNMTHRGEAGFHVLTPFEPTDGNVWIIVNRGWVRGGPDRSVLPEVGVDAGERRVRGRISVLPRPGLRLAGSDQQRADTAVEVVLFPTIDELERRLGRTLAGYQLLLDSEQPDGFVREWRPAGLPPERHLGYALQWLLLALLAAGAGGVVVFRSVREARS